MSRQVRIATVQPPAVTQGATPGSIQDSGLELLEQAARGGADIVCLPELLNAMVCGPDAAAERAGAPAQECLQRARAIAQRHQCYVVVPLVVEADGARRNRACIVGRDGSVCGHYDKVHLTRAELDDWRITPGSTYPVFELDFGRVGIMICYDGCFIEPSRILALQGAEIIFWPSLQRSYTESELSLQLRAHACFNYATVVRSSYGTERGQPWTPGIMAGLSGICGPDGHVLASLGRWVGWTAAVVDLDQPQLGERSFGGETGVLKAMRFADRRPDTYGPLVEGDPA